jgi:restriction system protein
MPKRTIKEAITETMKKVGHPLALKEIYDKIIEFDFYRFNAENPKNIVQVEVRRHCVGVDFPTAKPNKQFQLLNDGRYWIKDVPISGATASFIKAEKSFQQEVQNIRPIVEDLKEIHAKHEQAFKQSMLNRLMQIDPEVFERFSKKLLEIYGFTSVEVTKYSKDGGIDGYGKLKVGITYLNVAFQCKRWKTNSVGRTEVDKFRGAIQGDYEQGILITTANFSKDATNAMTKRGAVPIILIDGSTLVDIMIEKRFGVDAEMMPVYINALDKVLTDDL